MWVEELIGVVPPLAAMPPETATLSEITGRTHMPMAVLITGLRDKTLQVIGCLQGKPKFGGAIVSLSQARSVIPEEIRKKRAGRQGPRGLYKKTPSTHSPSIVPKAVEFHEVMQKKERA
ncbi:hypothetical protein AFEL58S_01890 [Afipia felis]